MSSLKVSPLEEKNGWIASSWCSSVDPLKIPMLDCTVGDALK
jgi:hypothetical protein